MKNIKFDFSKIDIFNQEEDCSETEKSQVIQNIHTDLKNLGINKGDLLLIHSSYKSMGKICGGAKTFFQAVLSYLGEEGTLVLPSLTFRNVNRENPVFNLKNTRCCIGYLPEYFRTQVNGVLRSLHPTHSCCAIGKLAKELIENHHLDDTPLGKNSPFTKIAKLNGKILFIGCSTDKNTTMHGVEELVDPIYLLDKQNLITYTIIDKNGNKTEKLSFRNNFIDTDKYYKQNYSKIEKLLKKGEIVKGKILQASCTLMLASAVWERGLEKLKKKPLYFVSKQKLPKRK